LLEAGVHVRERVADVLTKSADYGDAYGRDERDHDAVFDHRCPSIVPKDFTDHVVLLTPPFAACARRAHAERQAIVFD
jgi:hypothetical protein